MFFYIKFTRLSFENACWIAPQALRCQQSFSKPCPVKLISKDTHPVFSIYCGFLCFVSLRLSAVGWSAVCDCGIFWSYSLAFCMTELARNIFKKWIRFFECSWNHEYFGSLTKLTWSPKNSMNIPKIEFIAYIYIWLEISKIQKLFII